MKTTYPIIVSPQTDDNGPAISDRLYWNSNHASPRELPVLKEASPSQISSAPLESLYYVFEYEGFGGCTMAVSCLMCIPQNTHIFGMVNNRVGEKLLDALRSQRGGGGHTSM